MTHTLRQPLYTVAATCVGLSLLLAACAPTTHQADPTPTSTSTSTPTATDGCAGYLLKAQEEAFVRPRAANTDPAYYFYSSPDDRNQERTSLKGGNGQGPYSWVNADLTIGKSAVVDGATEQVFGHIKDEFFRGQDWQTFESFKADLDAYITHWNTTRRQVKLKGLTPAEYRNQTLREAA